MNPGQQKAAHKTLPPRSRGAWCATVALLTALLVTAAGCDEEEAGRTFRDVASSSIQAGVNDIMDGMVDGLFAVLQLGTDQDAASSTTTSTEP